MDSAPQVPTSEDEYKEKRDRMLAKLQARNPPPSSTASAATRTAYVDELLSRAKAAVDSPDAAVEVKLVQEIENELLLIRPGLQSRRLKDCLEQLRARCQRNIGLVDGDQTFSFASKTNKNDSGQISPSVPAEKKVDYPLGKAKSVSAAPKKNVLMIADKQNETIRLDGADEQLICFNNLENCRISIAFRASAVQMKSVKNCSFVFAPVSSSLLVRDCTDSVIVVATQQLRLHNSSGTRLHIAVRGAVMIEDCNDIHVAPYLVEGMNLDWNNENWKCVKDFNWLTTLEPSPHWKIMDETEWKEFKL